MAAWIWAREELADRREHRGPSCHYEGEPEWDRKLQTFLSGSWPCPYTDEFWDAWCCVMRRYEAEGIAIGRGAFAGWGDGEPGMVRAVWCLVRHLKPIKVVETGVGRGFTSRMILDALERNGQGHLWSIDLPPVQAPELHAQIGSAVDPELRGRWTYLRGTSRQRLPKLLRVLGEIDLFVHDSRHTEQNVRFELDRAWVALRPGGAVVVDDIDMNWGFHSFQQTVDSHVCLNCYAEPLRPDLKRFEGRGLFGIALKRPLATEQLSTGPM
jgi:hypothetical protein